jgi:hypothetical protein
MMYVSGIKRLYLALLLFAIITFSSAWVTTTPFQHLAPKRAKLRRSKGSREGPHYSLYVPQRRKATTELEEQIFDNLLKGTKLEEAVKFVRSHPDLDLNNHDRWNRIFAAIEEITEATDKSTKDKSLLQRPRMEMTEMYQTLKDQGYLRLFGAITKRNMPASGSDWVQPYIVKTVTRMSTNALTCLKQQPSHFWKHPVTQMLLLLALASAVFGVDFLLLLSLTLIAGLADDFFSKGALLDTMVKSVSPGIQSKITRHEAGHFLVAYLLGCPVEGCVLSAWDALHDPRFQKAQSVHAGTSYFDPNMHSKYVSSEDVDRRSTILMAGVAAEALNYGHSEGGSEDVSSLTSFLTNKKVGMDKESIRNQVQWGAMQATLLLREYQECYNALVEVLEQGGSLGDCIYAIENTT